MRLPLIQKNQIVFCSRVIVAVAMVHLSGCTDPEQQLKDQVQQAYEFLENKNPDAAIETLENIEHPYSDRPEVIEALAYAHSAREDPKAGFYFERVVQLDPQRSELLLFAAESYKKDANPKAATRAYKAYLEIHPDDPFVWKALGQIYSRQGQLQEATDAYLKTAELSSPNPPADLAIEIGNLFVYLKNIPQAENWFKIAIEQEPFSPEALLGLLKVTLHQERWSTAEKIAARLEREYPGLLEVSDMASVPQQLERWRTVRQELEKELRAHERALKELEKRTKPAEQNKKANTSVQEKTPTQKRLSAPPPRRQTMDPISHQAQQAMEAKNYPKAIKLYWQTINAGNASAHVWQQLSIAYRNSGNPTKAAIANRAAKDLSAAKTDPKP